MLPSVLPRLATDSAVRVFPGVWKLLFLRLPSRDRAPSLPLLSLFFFVFYIFTYLFSKTMSCFSGCLMFSAGIQKLFCELYSAFKCSFDEFVGEKVVSPSYSSAILLVFFHAQYIKRPENRFFIQSWGGQGRNQEGFLLEVMARCSGMKYVPREMRE